VEGFEGGLVYDGWKDKFEDNFSWEVESGREIRLWEDRWVDNMTLKESFPRLYTICSIKDSSIWQAGERSENSGWTWKIEWRRNLFECERNLEHQLMQIIGEHRVRVDKDDFWVWEDREAIVFTVKSAYKILNEDT